MAFHCRLFVQKKVELAPFLLPAIDFLRKFMSSTPNIGFVSLGCPKNLVDSERILTELRSNGYNIIPSYENADLVIVNTCGFIDSAV